MTLFPDRVTSQGGSAEHRRLLIFVLGFVLIVGGVGVLLYLPTFGASYAYDDMDYLNFAADVLAGKRGYWEVALRPHLEHFVPVLRMAFHASAATFGYEALPFRLMVFVAHLGSAFWLSLLARRHGGSDTAGIATGLAYVLPAGFSSMWVWLMTGAGVPLGLLGLNGSLAAIGFQDRIGPARARWIALATLAFALACESTLAPLALGPVLLDEYERRRAGRRGLGAFAVSAVLLTAAWVALSAFLFRRLAGDFSTSLSHGIPRSAFLLLVAPFRYLFPGLPLSRPADAPRTAVLLGPLFGLIIAVLVAAVFLAVRRRERELPKVAALTTIGPLAVLGLVGLGRWRSSFIELYDADRYFFTLLTPIALLVGSMAGDVRFSMREWSAGKRRAFVALVAIGLAAEFLVHGSALRRSFPRDAFDTHERRFRQLSLLASRLEEAARRLPPGAPPLEVPDGNMAFHDVHNHRVSSRFLLYVAARERPRRVRLDGDRVGERDAALLNPVLASWSTEIGEPTSLVVVRDGQLADGREGMADFRIHSNASRVVSGFYDWEGSSRWMGRRGELRLVMNSRRLVFLLASPVKAIQERNPAATPLVVRVKLREEASEKLVSLGDLTISEDGILTYRLDVPEPFASEARGKPVRLVLESARSWRPADVLAGSLDPRELSVQVFQAGFDGGT